MFAALFRNENTKLYRRSILWIELALTAVVILFINVAIAFAANAPRQVQGGAGIPPLKEMVLWPQAANNSGLASNVSGAGSMGGMLVVVLAAFVAAQEYSWRTVHLSVSRGVARSKLILAKFVALLPPVALLVTFTWVCNLAITAVITLNTTGGLPMAEILWGKIALSIVLMIASLLPYAALTFLLGTLTRSVIASAGITVGYAFLAEPLISQIFKLLGSGVASLTAYLPSGLNMAMFGFLRDQPAAGMMPAWQGALGVAFYTAAFVALAVVAFRKQDLTA